MPKIALDHCSFKILSRICTNLSIKGFLRHTQPPPSTLNFRSPEDTVSIAKQVHNIWRRLWDRLFPCFSYASYDTLSSDPRSGNHNSKCLVEDRMEERFIKMEERLNWMTLEMESLQRRMKLSGKEVQRTRRLATPREMRRSHKHGQNKSWRGREKKDALGLTPPYGQIRRNG